LCIGIQVFKFNCSIQSNTKISKKPKETAKGEITFKEIKENLKELAYQERPKAISKVLAGFGWAKWL
jgi:hypothetical protein